MPYDGPFKVVSRGEKTFVIDQQGKYVTVSIDRLKPAYILSEEATEPTAKPLVIPTAISLPIEQNGPTPQLPQALQNEAQAQAPAPVPEPVQVNQQQPESQPRRSTRRVRFVERYQARFN